VPDLPPEPDQFQQEPDKRNLRLAQLLSTTWLGFNVKAIRRDPVPSEPPNPIGPKTGRWIAETA
jgi:hypothetical protein